MDEEKTYGEAMMRRMHNLKMFRTPEPWTDEAIIEYLNNRGPKELSEKKPKVEETDTQIHARKFKAKLKSLQEEFGIDMNDTNDADALRSLVRLTMQLEIVDQNIRDLQSSKDVDTRELKNLGDYQRSVQMSITDLQNRLGIERRQRKEKQIDDIPKYIESLQDKAKTFWDRKTIPIRCERDEIELARVWVNFPKLNNKGMFELECWSCHERVVFSL